MPANQEEIRQRFSANPWHDSLLVNMTLGHAGDDDIVSIRVDLVEGHTKVGIYDHPVYKQYTLRFLRCNRIKMDVDLDGKKACSDMIYDAELKEPSEWKDKAAKEDLHTDYSGFSHFHILLCPTSGTIDILAEDFELVPVETT